MRSRMASRQPTATARPSTPVSPTKATAWPGRCGRRGRGHRPCRPPRRARPRPRGRPRAPARDGRRRRDVLVVAEVRGVDHQRRDAVLRGRARRRREQRGVLEVVEVQPDGDRRRLRELVAGREQRAGATRAVPDRVLADLQQPRRPGTLEPGDDALGVLERDDVEHRTACPGGRRRRRGPACGRASPGARGSGPAAARAAGRRARRPARRTAPRSVRA